METAVRESGTAAVVASTGQEHGRAGFAAALALAAICTAVTALASTRTSTTFDEIVLMAGGARGYATGAWDIAPEHPPLMQYVYGLPIHLSQPSYPANTTAPERGGDFGFRYTYSREFFFTSGNDPERLAFLGRFPAAVLAGLLVLAAWGFARRFGAEAGVAAAATVAFLPDVLAHGGVAYNDLPLALGWLLAVWAIDNAVREPTAGRGALAGLAVAFSLGIKFSAVLLAPVAAVLVVAGAIVSGRRPDWWRSLGIAAAAGLVATWIGLAVIYRGDFALGEFVYGLNYTFGHVSGGHTAPGFLMGRLSADGWWYYFPAAFLFKTPAALHILLLAAVAGLARAMGRPTLRSVAASPLRAPVIGILVFGAALLGSNLNIGFRYALPVLPLVCVITAAGVAVLWKQGRPLLRGGLAVLMLWFAGSSLAFYPHFLAYTSEYGPGADYGHQLLADSSLDWGQGLLDLRSWMEDRGVSRVYLSYFGSAVPAGYGIQYVAMPSFYALPPFGPPPPEQPLPYAVISATNLDGVYLAGDPFARFRGTEPDTVIARTLLVYRIADGPGD